MTGNTESNQYLDDFKVSFSNKDDGEANKGAYANTVSANKNCLRFV